MERQKDGLPVRLELSARDNTAFVEALLDPHAGERALA
jgi:hypothetical protein